MLEINEPEDIKKYLPLENILYTKQRKWTKNVLLFRVRFFRGTCLLPGGSRELPKENLHRFQSLVSSARNNRIVVI